MPTAVAEDVDERVLNARAMHVLRRVQAKLDGTDAPPEKPPIVFPSAWGDGGEADEAEAEDSFQPAETAAGGLASRVSGEIGVTSGRPADPSHPIMKSSATQASAEPKR